MSVCVIKHLQNLISLEKEAILILFRVPHILWVIINHFIIDMPNNKKIGQLIQFGKCNSRSLNAPHIALISYIIIIVIIKIKSITYFLFSSVIPTFSFFFTPTYNFSYTIKMIKHANSARFLFIITNDTMMMLIFPL